MKHTDRNNKPYINAAIFFACLMAAFILFAAAVPRRMPEGTGDGNGPHIFGAGAGNGLSDGIGNGANPGNSNGNDSPIGENPNAKNTEPNRGAGDGKGNPAPPPPPETDKNTEQAGESAQNEKKEGNKQKPAKKQNHANVHVATLYLDPNADDETQKAEKKAVRKTSKTAVSSKKSQPNLSDADVGGSRGFTTSGGKTVFRIGKNSNILFIVDISGSMSITASENQTRLSILQFQLKRTINEQHRKRSRGKYSIIAFSSQCYYFPDDNKGQYKFSFPHGIKLAEKWIDSFDTLERGATNLFTAIMEGLDRMKKQGWEVNTIFILTDGEPTDVHDPKQYLQLLKEELPAGIAINTISIGRTSDLLKKISQAHKGIYDEYK